MIYLTGDIHGDVNRLIYDIYRCKIGKDDIVVLLGDVGLNFFSGEYDDVRKQAVNEIGTTFFCIHGNHEMRPNTIASYKEIEWHGGKVYVEEKYKNILFAKDGEIFDLDGYRVIVLGGAYSVDKNYRLSRNIPWFLDEQPSDEIKQRAAENLESCSWLVDYVFSHTCPEKYIPTEAFLPNIESDSVDNSTEEWLDKIEDRLNYATWFCGHWHIDKHIDKMHFLMHSFETLPEMDTFTLDVDSLTMNKFKDLCESQGTTVDLALRAFLRFLVDDKNFDKVKSWIETMKKTDQK